MTVVDPAELAPSAAYRLLTGIVVPRPIAWVTSLHESGAINLAPFSCFTFVAYQPLLVGFVAGRKLGALKDTAANIERSGEFVVHIPSEDEVEAVHLSSIEHEPTVSEVDTLGLRSVPSDVVRTPRLADAPIALECRSHRVVEFGDIRSRFIVGEVIRVHLRDGLLVDGKISTEQLRPLSRLAGPLYSGIGRVVPATPLPARLAVEDR